MTGQSNDSPTSRISIIIPSYNSRRTIGRTLESLGRQTRQDLMSEFIIVDCSDDMETKRFISQCIQGNKKARLIRAPGRLTPGQNRNLGARQAAADLLVFLDSDVFLAEDYLECVYRHFLDGKRVGGGSMSLPEFQKYKPIALAQYFLQFNQFTAEGGIREERFVPSANLFCEKALFERIGGFPNLRASEDVVFGLEAGKREKIWFIPQAKAYHVFREKFWPFARNQMLLGEYILVYRRLVEPGRFYYTGIWPLFFLPAFVAIKFSAITFRIVRTGPLNFFKYIAVLPLFLIGLAFWVIGFVRAIFISSKSLATISPDKRFHP